VWGENKIAGSTAGKYAIHNKAQDNVAYIWQRCTVMGESRRQNPGK
jgi:hypothetical protein